MAPSRQHEQAAVPTQAPRRRALRIARWALLLTSAFALLLASAAPAPGMAAGARTVARCELTGTVDAGSAAYLADCIERAHRDGREALLVQLDTPGGALEATRQITRAMLNAPLPVLVWVGPAGARAGSAGVFITLAAHVAAMAPGTNIGAAHPVEGLSGADPEKALGKELARKVENDAVAFAQSLAHQRGRNEDWAAQAVHESASISAERAVALDVVDLLAPTEAALLAGVDGREVQLPSGAHALRTRGAEVVSLGPTVGQRLVHLLANPTLAYLLFLSGAFLLVVEFSHPGGFAPGILGATCLVLALIAFSALPIRAGAVLILVLGVALIAAELFTAHGALALSGTLLLFLGGLLLVDRTRPGWLVDRSFGLPLQVVLPTVLVLGGSAVYLVFKAAQTRRLPQRGGDAGLLGELGRALSALDASGGEVFVHGERWRAVAAAAIPEGAKVVVRRIDGLTLYVEEASHGSGRSGGDPHPAGNPVPAVHLGSPDRQRV